MKMNRKKLAVIIASALVLCLVVMIAVIGVKNRDKDDEKNAPQPKNPLPKGEISSEEKPSEEPKEE